MDALEEFDIVHDRRAAAPRKLAQAIELMAEGFQLKRAQLRARHPELSDAEVEVAFQAWLTSEDDL